MPSAEIILAGAINLTLLWFVYHFVWRPALLNHFRQGLFDLRDSLFEEAAQQRLQFEDPAYGMLRTIINRMIVRSGSMTPIHFLLFLLLGRRLLRQDSEPLPSIEDKFRGCVDKLPDQDQAEIYRKYFRDLQVKTIIYISCWTPVLGLLVFLVLILVPVRIVMRIASTGPARNASDLYMVSAAELAT